MSLAWRLSTLVEIHCFNKH